MNTLSSFAVPVFILIILIYSICKKASPFNSFVSGAQEGLKTVLSVFPSLLALICAVELMNESGLCDYLSNVLSPLLSFLNVPKELSPLAIIRPISGSGSTAVVQSLMEKYSPDSFIGRCASVIASSTETTFYTIAVYFGATKVTKMRHTVFCALLADISCVVIGCLVCRLFFC